MNETQLVLQAKSGDKDAFTALYSLYKERLYRYAFYRLGNHEDAQDAVSECIVSAFWQIGRLKKPEAFGGWLFRILYGTCAEQIKQQIRNRETADIHDYANTLTAETNTETDRTDLQRALALLKAEDREIVLLSVVAGCNSKEIGKLTGYAATTVRSKLARSLKKMREFLESDNYEK